MGQLLRQFGAVLLIGLLMLGLIFSLSQKVRQKTANFYYHNVRFRPWRQPTRFDADLDADMHAYLSQKAFGEINSVIVWQQGEVKFRYYAEGYDAGTLQRVFSISKSVTSALIGILTADNRVTPADKVADLLPAYSELMTADPIRAEMALEDLLTMRSGLTWNELSGPSYSDMRRSEDWINHMASLPPASEPGSAFTYNSGNTVLLGAVVDEVSAAGFEALLNDQLFRPLGIDKWEWLSGPNQVFDAGSGLHIGSEDLLKFGLLYLQEGVWEGEQLVSADWVAESTQTRVFNSSGLNYGYHWWQIREGDPLINGLDQNDIFLGTGFGGNYLYVIPHLDAVIVITGQNGPDMLRTDPLLRFYIFPALKGALKG